MKKTYASTDLYLCGFLKAKDMKLINVERDGRRNTFVFEDRVDREKLIKEFYNDGMVKVNDFKNAIVDLKSVIYNF